MVWACDEANRLENYIRKIHRSSIDSKLHICFCAIDVEMIAMSDATLPLQHELYGRDVDDGTPPVQVLGDFAKRSTPPSLPPHQSCQIRGNTPNYLEHKLLIRDLYFCDFQR